MPQTYYCPDKNYYCPICNNLLQSAEQQYTTEQLFSLWKPIEFSTETIQAHKNQSNYTELYKCPYCELEIFFPQIIGTSKFYIETYNLEYIIPSTTTTGRTRWNTERVKNSLPYSNDKWEFTEIQSDLKDIQSLLEVGCGEGAFLSKIKTLVPDLYGVEYNEEAINTSRKAGFIIYNSNDYNSISKKFDAIVIFHVLEHVANPKEFIQMLSNLLKDDGLLYISVPNQDGVIQFINPCIHNMPPHHATRWHKKTFEVLAQQLNFSINKIAYEPLSVKDHYYYTHYWINSNIISSSIIMSLFRHTIRKFSIGLFKFLNLFNIKYFKLLKGQSIYIILKKHTE